MTTINQLADRFDLYRAGNSWRGECPACHYGKPTLLLKERRNRISFACVSCGDRDAIAAALAAAGVGEKIDKADRMEAEQKAAVGRRKAAERAAVFWRGSEAATPDNPAGRYLSRRKLGFAIGNDRVRFRGDMPHPDHRKYPALVCRIDNAAGDMVAIQRVYLDLEGRKADVDPVKACKGPIWGGAIRYATGPEIVVAEGPESALAAGHLLGLPAWSSISAGNLARGLILPVEVRRVVIAADHDKPGIEAAEAAARRWKAEGRAVRIVRPDKPGDDFADVLAQRTGVA
ncbi:toprim domain-containing protein [Acidiphilium multivorum]|uniref:DUF7146 domain-containing protein n=1 Tax=Acidiphilium multivorum TaxID=62140 RepID=UPI0039C97759